MKIWVVGSKGMLGSHFCRKLTKNQYNFVTSDMDIDVTKFDEIRKFAVSQKITHIINCAAYTQVDKSEEEKELCYAVNAIGPKNLGKVARELSIKLVHFSTDYVFSGKRERPYQEIETCSPINFYGFAKLEGEKFLFLEHDQACVIRTSWLYGFPGHNFVETMLKLMKENEELNIVADQLGRPTYCGDLVDAALDLLNHRGIFHYANHEETSWYYFALEIYRQASLMGEKFAVRRINPISTEKYRTLAKRPQYSTLDTEKIEKTLSKAPRKWQQALNEYLKERKIHYAAKS